MVTKQKKTIKNKKNILLMISSFAGGGAERVTVNLANALSERYNVCVLTLYSNPDAYHPAENVQVVRYTDYIKSLPNLVRKASQLGSYMSKALWVKKIKREFRPDATISMLIVPNVLNALVRCGDFRIVSERADPVVIGGKYMKYTKLAVAGADHVVFQSKRVQNMFSGSVRKKSSIILNPADVRTEAADIAEKKIVTAGRLSEQKNHRMLINAFGRFSSTHPDHILEIYGTGPLRDELLGQISQMGLQDRVIIKDFASDLHEQIRTAEMFVLSSDFEGLSNALLEAMMMGLPCISTDCAGSDEVIRNMENGILVPVGDEDALYEAMCRMADDEGLRIKIKEAGRHDSERFRSDEVVRQWIELIERHS